MSKLAFLVPAVLVSSAGGAAAVYTVGAHAGLALSAAAPDTLIPATADAYVAIDRGADQGAALAHLWSAYQAHPGTAPALAHLRADMVKGGFDARRLTPLLSSLGDRAALAMWVPSGKTSQPGLAVVAQTQLTSLVGGGNPLRSLARTAPAWVYEGMQVYRVTFDQGGSGYGCLLSGDAVLTTDAATMKRVVDTAAGRVPALATDKTFTTTLASLPSARALTAYVAPSVSMRLRHELDKGYATLPPATRQQLRRLQPAIDARPYGLSVTASNDGLAFNTTALPASQVRLAATPNAAADILARDTVYYASQDNLNALITPYLSLLPAGSLGQFEQQTGIDVRRDVLGWMNGEFAIGINSGVSPVVARFVVGMNARSQETGATMGPVTQGLSSQQSAGTIGGGRLAAPVAPSLPGSIELAWHVNDPAAVQRSLDRLTALAARDTNAPGSLLTISTLPDGTRVTSVATLPGLGYAFHGHWLIASSNLNADLGMTAAPLSSDPAYGAALAHVSPGTLTSVSYLDVTRLLSLADAWVGYARGAGLMSGAGGSDGWTWAQAEPLIAPLHSVVAVTHQGGARDTRVQAFAAIGG